MTGSYVHGEGRARHGGQDEQPAVAAGSILPYRCGQAARFELGSLSTPNPRERHDTATSPRRMARHRLVSRRRTIARRLAVAQRALSVRRYGGLSESHVAIQDAILWAAAGEPISRRPTPPHLTYDPYRHRDKGKINTGNTSKNSTDAKNDTNDKNYFRV